VSSSSVGAPGSIVEKPPRRRRAGFREGGGWQAIPFVVPAITLVIFGLVVPVIWTVILSVNRTRGLNFGDGWVGFENYERLLTRDRRFLNTDEFPWSGALVNNIRWLIVYPALCIVLGLITAVLATRVRYEAAFKAIIFVPMAISATAVAVIWRFVYSPDANLGVLNAGLGLVGIDPVSWLGRADTVNYAIIVGYVWASTGFVMVVLSAALKGISQEVIEAARTDGATEWDIFRRVQLPLLSLPIAVVTVWMIINVIKVFDIIYAMTTGGPGGASRVIAYSYYVETFENGKGGYGAAVAVLMILLIIPVMIWQIRRFRTEAVTGH
jgi:alpha-glucoside transport system permease protein